MVYTENTETWCECDGCHLTIFAGFNATIEEVKSSFVRDGWTIGKKVACPYCKMEGKA